MFRRLALPICAFTITSAVSDLAFAIAPPSTALNQGVWKTGLKASTILAYGSIAIALFGFLAATSALVIWMIKKLFARQDKKGIHDT